MIKLKIKTPDWYITAALFLMAILLFWKNLFLDHVFFYRDFYRYFYPGKVVGLSLLKKHGLSAWNPYFDGGMPLLADLSHQYLLYPGNLIFIFFEVLTGFNWLAILHFVLAGLGMHCFSQAFGLNRRAAFICSISFVLSGIFLSSFNRPGYLYTLSWLPWIMWSWQRLRVPSFNRILLHAVMTTFQFFAGEVQVLLLSHILGVVFYWVWFFEQNQKPVFKAFLKVSVVSLLMFLGLSAVQLLPTWELSQLSTRGEGLPFARLTRNSLHPMQWLTLWVPMPFDLFPNEASFIGMKQLFQSPGIPVIVSVHCGSLVFLGAVLGFTKLRSKSKWVLAGLGVYFMLLSLGRYFPTYFEWARYLFPFSSSFAFPMKYHLPVQVLFSVFLGIGLKDFSFEKKTLILSLSLTLGLVLILFGMICLKTSLGTSVWPQVMLTVFFLGSTAMIFFLPKFQGKRAMLFSVLLFVELFYFAPKLIWTCTRDFYTSEHRLFEHFPKEEFTYLPNFRIAEARLKVPDTIRKQPGLSGLVTRRKWFFESLRQNTGAIHGLAYTDKYGPLRLKQTHDFWVKTKLTWHDKSRLYGTRYFLGSKMGIEKNEGVELRLKHDNGHYLFEDTSAKPMVWLTQEEGNRITQFEHLDDGYRILLDLKSPTELVVSENTYPGWQALADDKHVSIHSLHGVFKKIRLDPQTKHLELRFQPKIVQMGLMISILTSILLLGLTLTLPFMRQRFFPCATLLGRGCKI